MKKLKLRPVLLIFLAGLLISDRSGVGCASLAAAAMHECGHLIAARMMKIPLRELKLDLLGARLEVAGRMISYGEEWLLAAAGPMVSLIAAAAAAPLWGKAEISVAFSCASLILGAINLMPVKGFDGGRMLSCTMSRFFEERKAEKVLRGTSIGSAFLLWTAAVWFLLKRGDGLSLFCFSMSLLAHCFEETER